MMIPGFEFHGMLLLFCFEQLNTRIQYTDDKINKLVYTLLSEEWGLWKRDRNN